MTCEWKAAKARAAAHATLYHRLARRRLPSPLRRSETRNAFTIGFLNPFELLLVRLSPRCALLLLRFYILHPDRNGSGEYADFALGQSYEGIAATPDEAVIFRLREASTRPFQPMIPTP